MIARKDAGVSGFDATLPELGQLHVDGHAIGELLRRRIGRQEEERERRQSPHAVSMRAGRANLCGEHVKP